jgi:hypothetical protein
MLYFSHQIPGNLSFMQAKKNKSSSWAFQIQRPPSFPYTDGGHFFGTKRSAQMD